MKRQQGFTMIEVILVLIVAMGIVWMSVNQYLSYRRDADIYRLQAAVDMIFKAMDQYYRINCYGFTDTSIMGSAIVTPGSLYPAPNGGIPASNSVAIPLSTLYSSGFLSNPGLLLNPIVNNSLGNGYVLQFNEYQQPKYLNGQEVGTIIIWKAQVAVLLNNPSTGSEYKSLLSADCLSSESGTTVIPCSSGALISAPFAVWERLPSLASTTANSAYWASMPLLKEFSLMYNVNNEQLNYNSSNDHPYVCTN